MTSLKKLNKEQVEAPIAWVGLIGNDLVSIQIPITTQQNPKSYFNSLEGVKKRYESKILLDKYA